MRCISFWNFVASWLKKRNLNEPLFSGSSGFFYHAILAPTKESHLHLQDNGKGENDFPGDYRLIFLARQADKHHNRLELGGINGSKQVCHLLIENL